MSDAHVLSTLAWVVTPPVFLLVHGDVDPAAKDWAHLVEGMHAHRDYRSILVYSGGANLSASQRADVVASFKERKLTAAVMTESALVRGAATAISWFGVQLRAFPEDQLVGALQFLDAASEESAIRGHVRHLKGALRDAAAS